MVVEGVGYDGEGEWWWNGWVMVERVSGGRKGKLWWWKAWVMVERVSYGGKQVHKSIWGSWET